MMNRTMMIAGLVGLLSQVLPAFAQTKVEYNRDIRPILAENCFACHGPDSAARKASLRLDQREAALKKEVFVPGKAKDSPLVKRIHMTKKGMMPPASSHKKLTPAQKETLERWIDEGAEYQPHWS